MHKAHWLALETSTDTLSLAVARGEQTWTHTSAGGARTSTHMIPEALALLAEAGLGLRDLQAVVFGRGPGAFTGLRTACAVAQGLALGANLPVLPIDTLLAVAEEARWALSDTQPVVPLPDSPLRVLAVMDARMDQLYVAAYEHHANDGWQEVQAAELQSPEALRWPADWGTAFVGAGNAWPVYAGRWPAALGATLSARLLNALPTAAALLRLAPAAWAQGLAVPPEHALPLYVRDKVAQTTDERAHFMAQRLATPTPP